MERRLRTEAARQLAGMQVSIGFHQNATMPDLLRQTDLLVHPSIADLESVSVLEGMACGAVPIIAQSDLSAAGHFALTQHSLFPVGRARSLAEQIDWWIDHPDVLAVWSRRYAEHAKEHYSLDTSVRAFAHMAVQAVSDQEPDQVQSNLA